MHSLNSHFRGKRRGTRITQRKEAIRVDINSSVTPSLKIPGIRRLRVSLTFSFSFLRVFLNNFLADFSFVSNRILLLFLTSSSLVLQRERKIKSNHEVWILRTTKAFVKKEEKNWEFVNFCVVVSTTISECFCQEFPDGNCFTSIRRNVISNQKLLKYSIFNYLSQRKAIFLQIKFLRASFNFKQFEENNRNWNIVLSDKIEINEPTNVTVWSYNFSNVESLPLKRRGTVTFTIQYRLFSRAKSWQCTKQLRLNERNRYYEAANCFYNSLGTGRIMVS